jgi:hypothetical protein
MVVKEPAAHVNEGVGAAVGGVPRGLAVDVLGLCESQRRLDDRAAFGIEAATGLAAPVQRAGHVQ